MIITGMQPCSVASSMRALQPSPINTCTHNAMIDASSAQPPSGNKIMRLASCCAMDAAALQQRWQQASPAAANGARASGTRNNSRCSSSSDGMAAAAGNNCRNLPTHYHTALPKAHQAELRRGQQLAVVALNLVVPAGIQSNRVLVTLGPMGLKAHMLTKQAGQLAVAGARSWCALRKSGTVRRRRKRVPVCPHLPAAALPCTHQQQGKTQPREH